MIDGGNALCVCPGRLIYGEVSSAQGKIYRWIYIYI